jgi:hypothetical protein
MHRFSRISVFLLVLCMGACGSKPEPRSAQSGSAPEVSPGRVAEAAVSAGNASETKAAPAPVQLEGTVYGDGVDVAQSVSISDLLANPDDYAGKTVRIEGTISGVCPKRGCWFDIAGATPGQKVRFKVRDGVMVFPLDETGKFAVAQGVVKKIPMTLEQSKQYAEYQAREYGADMDPAEITEPITLVRLDGTGAVIRDKP